MATKDQLQKTLSHAYPSQHIGHIEAQHIEALEKFRTLCEQKKYYTPAHNGAAPSHDDETLLRYLRARKWDVQAAFGQFKSTEDWRKENQIDLLYERIDVNEFNNGAKLYPQFIGRRDKRGIPLYVFEVSHLTTKAVAAFTNASHKPGEVESKLPAKQLRLFALYEALTRFALPLCSYIPNRPYPETPVSQSSNIVDISNVSLRQFWNLKSHMQDASQLATEYYPETLDRIFIIGAPAFFPTVWGWIKRWFDPITVSKIFILSSGTTLSTLQEFIDIENIPKKYGGKLDFAFGEPPNLEPEIQNNLKWTNPDVYKGRNTFPIGPVMWRKSGGTMVATAVGTQDGKHREVEVASIVDLPPDRGQVETTALRPVVPAELKRLPSGMDTHPPTPPSGETDLDEPPSGTSTPASSVRGTPNNGPADAGRDIAPIPFRNNPAKAANNTPSSVPTSHPTEDPSSKAAAGEQTSPEGLTDTVRAGTTGTRFEQQSSTHGHGQLEEHTPEVREGVAGDKHGVMEPGTVSQAPKEHPLPPQAETQDSATTGGAESATATSPSMLEQVQATAGSMLEKVVGVVGLADTGKDESVAQEVAGEKGPSPEAVEKAPQASVEEYLRDQTKSQRTNAEGSPKAE